MIDRNEIIRHADADRLPAPTIERDYILSHVLAAVAACEQAERIVFKGGTALRLCYFEDYRYSEDLVRHEAPYDRAGVKGLRRGPVAAGS